MRLLLFLSHDYVSYINLLSVLFAFSFYLATDEGRALETLDSTPIGMGSTTIPISILCLRSTLRLLIFILNFHFYTT